ncbi:unnamed protein product [Eruca vesicaria subsp. sativa]|uniref:Uncharacterized protein n=1 Tax=Eruca vesicaria subsp. sativa TaxID=29727 RepID=A0ABC8L5S4_ERUVS|nr:unnamed protein product [Eruca vesicaria subsp. sativa]
MSWKGFERSSSWDLVHTYLSSFSVFPLTDITGPRDIESESAIGQQTLCVGVLMGKAGKSLKQGIHLCVACHSGLSQRLAKSNPLRERDVGSLETSRAFNQREVGTQRERQTSGWRERETTGA